MDGQTDRQTQRQTDGETLITTFSNSLELISLVVLLANSLRVPYDGDGNLFLAAAAAAIAALAAVVA
jgi:hypothetical protein